jgi:hypothetical protein
LFTREGKQELTATRTDANDEVTSFRATRHEMV